MGRKFVWQLAKELHSTPKAVVQVAQELGLDVRSHMSQMDLASVDRIRKHFATPDPPKIREQVRPGVVRRGEARAPKGEETPLHDPLRNVPMATVPWTLLPPGTWDARSIIEDFERHAGHGARGRWDRERLARICRELRPSQCWRGEDEFDGYVVFGFSHTTTVVMDRPLVGQALYVIRSNWPTLSRLPKRQLLEDHPDEVRRLVHRGDWLKCVFRPT